MRLEINGTQLTGLSQQLADDADRLTASRLPRLESSEIGHPRLAEAIDHFETAAELGVVQLAKAGQALSDWMLLAAQVAEADDQRLASELRAQHPVPAPAPIRNRGAEAAVGGGS